MISYHSTNMQYIKSKKYLILVAELFFLCSQILIFALGSICSDFYIKLQEFVFLSFYLFVVSKSIKRNGFITFYTIFLLLCFFFNFGRFYLDLIGYSNINIGIFFGKYEFSDTTIASVIIFMQFVLFFIDIAYYTVRKYKIKQQPLSENILAKKIIITVMCITLPFSLYASFLTFNYVKNNGYEAFLLYIVTGNESIIPSYLILADHIFKFFFYVSFFYNFTKKQYYFIFSLYFINLVAVGLKGSRSTFLFPFFFFATYLIGYKKIIRLNMKSILVFCILAFSFYLFASSVRGLNTEKTSFNNIINAILYSQTVTILLPFLYIEKSVEIQSFNTFPILFSDLFSEYIHIRTYNITSIIAHTNLYGLASSMFLELIDLSILFVPVCFLIGFMIRLVHSNVDKNRFANVFVIILGMSLPWMPRDCVLRVLFKTNIIFIVSTFFLYLTLEFISKYSKRRIYNTTIRGGVNKYSSIINLGCHSYEVKNAA